MRNPISKLGSCIFYLGFHNYMTGHPILNMQYGVFYDKANLSFICNYRK